jgi:predicted cupin superfamily sugar epimerase
MMDADAIIGFLDLRPHPEGGFFREIFRDTDARAGRAHSTAIYYLLRAGETSRWHRVDATEVWHFYTGAPLELLTSNGSAPSRATLGTAFDRGQQPVTVVPRGIWQSARSLGDFTLCGCTVAPGFEFAGFELAPPAWTPASKPG